MFRPRFSTFTVLAALAVGTVLGFCACAYVIAGSRSLHRAAQAARARADGAPGRPGGTVAAVAKSDSAIGAGSDLEAAYRRLMAAPATPDRDRRLLAAIEALAARAPLRAVADAEGCTSQPLRTALFEAAFRGWGRVAPDAAVEWILTQTNAAFDPDAAVASVLKGTGGDSEQAVQVALHACELDPEQARNYGDALIYALGQHGSFRAAADFASRAPDALRGEWLAAAYGSWTSYQPDAAATAALALEDPVVRRGALDAVIAHWGSINPEALADFAVAELPSGEQKNRALANALVQWSATNPQAAAQWINRFGASPEFDAGEAAIATQPDVMKQPSTALRWAQAVSDAGVRSRTIMAIVQTWSLSDPSAAVQYLRTTADLLPADRAELLRSLSPTP